MDAQQPTAESSAAVPEAGQRRVGAFISSFLLGAGAGHATRGHLIRGLIWLVAVYVATALVPIVRLPALGAMFLLHLIAAFDAAGARKRPVMPPWSQVVMIWIAILFTGMAVRQGFRMFHYEAFKNPSDSMAPTLLFGDQIFVIKHGGFKRGDIVTFRRGEDASKLFLKRIVAVAGDTVELRARQLYLNGKPIQRSEGKPCLHESWTIAEDKATSEKMPCVAYTETLDARSYQVYYSPSAPPSKMAPVTVPEGHVFVLGDNRDNSADSRMHGTIKRDDVVGRAIFVWFSSSPKKMRPERFGMDLAPKAATAATTATAATAADKR